MFLEKKNRSSTKNNPAASDFSEDYEANIFKALNNSNYYLVILIVILKEE